MEAYHQKYPQYNFQKNKGYGTREHLEALQAHGVCPIHRRSFRGVRELLASKMRSPLPTLYSNKRTS
jgi:ribonuclease HII